MPMFGIIEQSYQNKPGTCNWGVMIHAENSTWYFLSRPTDGKLCLVAPPLGFAIGNSVSFEEDDLPSSGEKPPPGFHFAKNIKKLSMAEVCSRVKDKPMPMTPVRVLSTQEKKGALGDDILKNIVKLEEKARKKLAAQGQTKYNNNQTQSLEQTVCFMWTIENSWNEPTHELSGGSLTTEQRASIKAKAKEAKETTCAEENLLCHKGARKWIYSLAFDRINGWKHACHCGCSKLLKKHKIVDLSYHLD
jgi:hypothetical protein